MGSTRLELQASLCRELFEHVRGGPWAVVDADQRLYAVYDTAFNGVYRFEVGLGPECVLAVEHVSGAAASDWRLNEYFRRLAVADGSATGDDAVEPSPPPDDVDYLADLALVDAASARTLIDTVQALDGMEPACDSTLGRDGMVVSGGVSSGTDDGHRFIAWSPEPDEQPDHCSFFWAVWCYVVRQAEEQRLDPALNLDLLDPYLARPSAGR